MFREDSSQFFYLSRGMLAGDGEAEVAGGGAARIIDVRRENPRSEKLAAQERWVGWGEGDDGSEATGRGMAEVFPKQLNIFEELRAKAIVAEFERG